VSALSKAVYPNRMTTKVSILLTPFQSNGRFFFSHRLRSLVLKTAQRYLPHKSSHQDASLRPAPSSPTRTFRMGHTGSGPILSYLHSWLSFAHTRIRLSSPEKIPLDNCNGFGTLCTPVSTMRSNHARPSLTWYSTHSLRSGISTASTNILY
jgi:hypothetical protein